MEWKTLNMAHALVPDRSTRDVLLGFSVRLMLDLGPCDAKNKHKFRLALCALEQKWG